MIFGRASVAVFFGGSTAARFVNFALPADRISKGQTKL